MIVEPMMAEGGDIHLNVEFLRGLRQLARRYSIPFIIDEVQTGFGTAGDFLWWQHLGLDGLDDAPDMVTLAKKAGLGIVLSRWPDPEPAPVHVASAVRGHIHLEHMGEMRRVEAMVQTHLNALAEAFPVVEHPRAVGTTFAFELPDPKAVTALIQRRLTYGFMTYSAGERTVRFRLNASWQPGHVAKPLCWCWRRACGHRKPKRRSKVKADADCGQPGIPRAESGVDDCRG